MIRNDTEWTLELQYFSFWCDETFCITDNTEPTKYFAQIYIQLETFEIAPNILKWSEACTIHIPKIEVMVWQEFWF